MGAAGNKQIVQAFYDATDRGDITGAFARLADDIKWTNIGSMKYSGCFTGKQDLTSRLLAPVFSQLKDGIKASIDNVIAEGDYVAVQLRGRAETKSGKPYNNTYCHIFTIRGGRVQEVMEYLDTELASKCLT